jgi:hypothetical protein
VPEAWTSETSGSWLSDDDNNGGDRLVDAPATAKKTWRREGPVPPINRKTTVFRVG